MTIWSRNKDKPPATPKTPLTPEPPTRILGRAAVTAEDVPVDPSEAPDPKLFGGIDVSSEPETAEMARDGAPKPVTDEPMTSILRPDADDALSENEDADLPAGVLVIIAGPGKGQAVPYGFGVNMIGRAVGQRIRLDFGDTNISRENHAQLIFDPQSRKIMLRHEQGTNLTYARGEAVLTPMELAAREVFQVADTKLMVLPLCDETWDWADQ